MYGQRFTDGRVPASGIVELFTTEHRWQRWLDVEAALAEAEAEVGVIPKAAAKAIVRRASVDQLDLVRVERGILETSHSLMALIHELSDAVGDPYGGWVHWGATTQNITQTGDVLVLREAHSIFLDLVGQLLDAMATLAERGQNMVCAGRTHGQQAVPITFGLKVAAWIDECDRHAERLREVEKRVFTAMVGGAAGSFASLGNKGPMVQDGVARRLRLRSMPVPSRAISDSFAEYVSILGLIAGTGGKIAAEVYNLMKTEVGEVREPAPAGTIGSSTMPHKYNPQLSDDCITISAQIRALVPLALEGMLHDHEVNGANSVMMSDAIQGACTLTGDLLVRLIVILSGLELDEKRMRANLNITGGLLSSESVMLALGAIIGRQRAHDVVYDAAQAVIRRGERFEQALLADSRVMGVLDEAAIKKLLDPTVKTGLSAKIARAAAARARKKAAALRDA